jgi:hypothetical protein
MARRCKRFAPLLGLSVLVALLAGCVGSAVQGTKYTAFKDSTAVLAQDTRTSYEGVQSLWEELTAQCLAMPSSKAEYVNVLSKSGIPCGKTTGGEVREFENPQPRLDARLQAMDTLARYASVLNTLATTDYAAGVDASTAKLTASLDNLEAALAQGGVPVTPTAKAATSAISTVVRLVATSYVNGERQKALHELLKDTQQSIADLAIYMKRDNGEISSMAKGYSEFYVGRAQEARPSDYKTAKAYDAEVLKVYKKGKYLEAAFRAQDKMLDLLPLAHKELLDNLDKPKGRMEQLEAFVGAAEQVLVLMQQIKNI